MKGKKTIGFLVTLAVVDGLVSGLASAKAGGLVFPGWLGLVNAFSIMVILPVLRKVTTTPMTAKTWYGPVLAVAVPSLMAFFGTYMTTDQEVPTESGGPVEEVVPNETVEPTPDPGPGPVDVMDHLGDHPVPGTDGIVPPHVLMAGGWGMAVLLLGMVPWGLLGCGALNQYCRGAEIQVKNLEPPGEGARINPYCDDNLLFSVATDSLKLPQSIPDEE